MMSGELAVSLGGVLVGWLRPTRRGARFVYADAIVQERVGQPLLSLSLPVKARPYAEGRTGSWFRGLLPEGKRLEAVARRVGCDEGDYYSILMQIGWECAGAVSITECAGAVSITEAGFEPPCADTSAPLSDAALAKKLTDLPVYGGIDPLARVSLGGYQEKLLVIGKDIQVKDGIISSARWREPSASAISTHIIKPQPEGRYAGIVEAEAWAMNAAARAARCARTALLYLEGAPSSLVVERYDRMWRGGVCERIHQEDCCQALGIDPRDKYAGHDMVRGSDPTYAGIARLLRIYAADPSGECAELLRQIIVNVVLGNVDAHAKNYSLIYRRSGTPEVSPLYDVVPVTDIEPRATHLSMRIDGKVVFEDVGRAEILNEARGWGMSAHEAESVLDMSIARLEEGLERGRRLYPNATRRHEPGARRRIAKLSS